MRRQTGRVAALSRSRRAIVVALSGAIDASTDSVFARPLVNLARRQVETLVVDAFAVTFMDNAGVELHIDIAVLTQANGGRLVLRRPLRRGAHRHRRREIPFRGRRQLTVAGDQTGPMMDATTHWRTAETLLTRAAALTPPTTDQPPHHHIELAVVLSAQAQAHAILALAKRHVTK